MNLLLAGVMLFSGGSVIAMQNEEISDVVNDTVEHVSQYVQNRLGRRIADTVSETGFPYPQEAFLSTLTEDQVFAITSEIDVINATYDWSNMTEEEISVALQEVHQMLDDLYTELGVEAPQTQNQYRGANSKAKGKMASENAGTYDGECPYDDIVDDSDIL
ncbi:hypothetical protein [Mariniplasma anaerobium]|uniref:Uncharacterized protein n=1 Tax=Mariniplasma anaerobium TaxID=2735436 RepID=A0A7R7ZF71_9MOLU|nr:hypothetical protein [Mariniplasma anaerobium]BCR35920.1 hypothetical protein MPAN_008130 [Mariniplasma anaerobium]